MPSCEVNLTTYADLPYKDAKRRLLDGFERRYVARLIERHCGNLSAASREAKVSRRHLRDLLRRYGLYAAALPANAESAL